MGQSGRGLRAANKSQDVKRQVDSDDKNQIPIYQLINVKNGGGKLIELIKSTAKHSGSGSEFNQTFSYSNHNQTINNNNKPLDSEHPNPVDRQIHDLVEPLLYNGGRGKLIPLSRIWMSRMGRIKEMHDDDADDDNRAPGEPRTGGRHRWVCWRLEERGFVGETALHICFLLSTPTHMILAKKLLSLFPMLINDIYTCDEYFGESSLHMAIVNEDIRIVKLLLDHGANVHERCLGSFFLPFDQKDRANDTIRGLHQENEKDPSIVGAKLNQFDLESNQLMGLATNYNGYAYWGEYPLSFAACLGLTDCYKLLLAKGANPNRQDSNGNSTLHMAVIADRIDVFDLCYSSGANLDLLNWQKLNPLTLAAKLKRVNMFFHILTIQRQVNWIFCNVGFAETPLAGIDSINSQDGSCDENSALSIVVFGASTEHLQMLDGLLDQLLTIKWTTAARKRFRLWLCQFLLFMLISMVAYCGRFKVALAGKEQTSDRFITTGQLENIYEYSQYAVICFVVYYLWAILSRIVPKLTISAIIRSLAQAPEISIFFVTCLLILICIPLRYFGLREAEDIVAALVMFTLPLKFLFFCRASKSVGPFVVVIYKCVSNDILCFIVLLAIFVAGFSQSLQIIFKSHRSNLTLNATTSTTISDSSETIDRNYFNNVLDGIVSMHMMALNEFGFVFDEFNSTDYPKLAKLLFIIYMILVSILLINMIIAMLGKTYQDIVSQPNENLRQWARALLIVERMMWNKRERLSVLDRYSHRPIVGDSGHCGRHFGFTWALSERDCQEIKHSKRLKADNSRYAPRLVRRQYDDGAKKLPPLKAR